MRCLRALSTPLGCPARRSFRPIPRAMPSGVEHHDDPRFVDAVFAIRSRVRCLRALSTLGSGVRHPRRYFRSCVRCLRALSTASRPWLEGARVPIPRAMPSGVEHRDRADPFVQKMHRSRVRCLRALSTDLRSRHIRPWMPIPRAMPSGVEHRTVSTWSSRNRSPDPACDAFGR